MKILEDRIIWDREDFIAGYVPQVGSTGSAYRYNFTGAANMSNIDPFSIYPGILFPGPNPTNITGTSGGGSPVPNSVLVDATLDLGGSDAYCIGTDLHKLNVVTPSFTATGAWPHAIDHGHANETGALGSVAMFNVSGSSRLFYSFNDDTDGDVGMYDLSATFDDDWFSTHAGGTALLKGRAHPLFVASDDRMLIGDYVSSAGKVHSYKGSSDTINTNVLNLPVGMEIVGFTEVDYDTWVFATTARGSIMRGRSAAFLWDISRPASYYKTINILDDEVSAPFRYAGTVGCFTRSRNGGRCCLQIFEGGEFVPKFFFSGSIPSIGGVEVVNSQVRWNSGGAIYSWGPFRNQFEPATHQVTSGSGSSSGFLKSFSDGSAQGLFASSGNGTSGAQIFQNYNSSATWMGSSASPNWPLRKKGKITGVQMYLSEGSSGGGRSINLSLYDSDTQVAYGITGDFTSYTSTDSIKVVFPESFQTPYVPLFFRSIAPYIQYSTGSGATSAIGVERIEVFYEPTDFVAS